jgi:hypothetical protein
MVRPALTLLYCCTGTTVVFAASLRNCSENDAFLANVVGLAAAGKLSEGN